MVILMARRPPAGRESGSLREATSALVYVHICEIASSDAAQVEQVIHKATKALDGAVKLSKWNGNDLALFMDNSSNDRAHGAARLVRAIIQGNELRHISGMRVSIGVTTVAGQESEIAPYVERARQGCHATEQLGEDGIEIITI